MFDKKYGMEIKAFFRIKETFYKFTDNEFNRLADILSKFENEDLSLRKIFLESFKNHPKLLVDIVKVIK